MKNRIFLFFWMLASNVCVANSTEISISAGDISTAEVVFNWERDKCAKEQIPDAAVRAFRTANDHVQMYAPNDTNQPFVGKTLDTVRPKCDYVFKTNYDSDPENYSAKIWLQSFYTLDGKTVYALGSSDYHGSWFNKCTHPTDRNKKCWWSAITLATSTNGGESFEMLKAPNHIIARAPHRYDEKAGPPPGFFTASNIIKRDDFYYSMIFTFGYLEQDRGNCLMRTKTLSDPRSWKTWDGTEFNGSFVNPADKQFGDAKTFSCATVGKLSEPVRSLIWHEASKRYIVIFSKPRKLSDNEGVGVRVEFQYATSTDLIEWTQPSTIIAFDSEPSCKKNLPSAGYPSLLDPESTDRNFGTIGARGYIYYTRFNSAKDCKGTYDRDLMRIPIKITSGNGK